MPDQPFHPPSARDQAAETISHDEAAYAVLSKAIPHDVTRILSERTERARNMGLGGLALFVTVTTAAPGTMVPLYVNSQVQSRFETFKAAELEELYFFRDIATPELPLSDPGRATGDMGLRVDKVSAQVTFIEAEYLRNAGPGSRRRVDLDARIAERRDVALDRIARTAPPAAFADFVIGMAGFADFRDSELEVLAQALGRTFLSAPNGAADWTGRTSAYAELLPLYTHTMERARNERSPEFRLLFEPARLFLQDRTDARLPQLVAEIDRLSGQDMTNFVHLGRQLLDGTWMSAPNADAVRVSQRFGAFVDGFAGQSETLSALRDLDRL